MSDEAFAVDVQVRTRRERVGAGLRTPANWFELVRFATVGASGYAVNLVVFAQLHGTGMNESLAATCAFLVALANNFVWNRHWTFRAGGERAGFQAARFFVVSLGAFLFSLLALNLLLDVTHAAVMAQAIAIVLATPMNFLGNKLWSFRSL